MNFKTVLSKPRFVAIGALALLALLCVLVFVILRAYSHQKIEPYELVVELAGQPSSTVFLSYDYGYGIADQHIRRLSLDTPSARFTLSVSAWKKVHALYFIAPEGAPYKLKALSIAKNGIKFDVPIPSKGPTLEGTNWLYRLPLTDFDY